MSSDGKILVYDGETILSNYNFTFLPYWKDTKLSLEIPTEKYKVDIYSLTIVIENADGISTSIFVDLNVVKASATGWIIGLSSILIVAVVFRRHKK